VFLRLISRRKKEEGRRKKEEEGRKKEEGRMLIQRAFKPYIYLSFN
jgi:hypothetical protein